MFVCEHTNKNFVLLTLIDLKAIYFLDLSFLFFFLLILWLDFLKYVNLELT